MMDQLVQDERTKRYLKEWKDKIGLVSVKRGYEEEKLNSVEEIKVYINTSDIKIGKNEGGMWVAQFSQRVGIDDYNITRMYFLNKPDASMIRMADLISNIENYFAVNSDKVYFDCWECGCRSHWLDIDGDLKEKWDNFCEQYCGC